MKSTMQRIRRFDIFAIFNKVSQEGKLDEAHAKGYGIWMARMVASKKFSKGYKSTGNKNSNNSSHSENKPAEIQEWKSLSGKPQTDVEYEKELGNRFGSTNLMALENYIRKAYQKGIKYEAIRDCEHYANNGNRFQTGFCIECSNNFKNVLKERI